MNNIYIKDIEKKTVVNIEDENFTGYSFFNDGRIEPINSSVLNVFNAFFLSNNYTELPKYKGYNVVLDNETGLKHYFKGDSEDFLMLFDMNGEDATKYDGEEEKTVFDRENYQPKAKMFKIGKTIVETGKLALIAALITCVAYASAYGYHAIKYQNSVKQDGVVQRIESATVDGVIKKIMESSALSDKDKEFLCNRDFLNDIIPIINQSPYSLYLLDQKLTGLSIQTYDNTNKRNNGYYSSATPNVLYIAQSEYSSSFEDIISHEFIHLWQDGWYYNVLGEACAEIMSEEYFNGALRLSYTQDTYNVKRLMEVIGPEPILRYTLIDDFAAIEREVMPYFSEEEMEQFRDSLHRESVTSPNFSEEETEAKRVVLFDLTNKLYERKFGANPYDDEIMQDVNSPDLIRFYFNSKRQEMLGSFFTESVKSRITLEQACQFGIVNMYQTIGDTEVPVSYEDFMNNKYDTSKEVEFGYDSYSPAQVVREEDNQLHVYVYGVNKTPVPNVEDSIRERSAGRSK